MALGSTPSLMTSQSFWSLHSTALSINYGRFTARRTFHQTSPSGLLLKVLIRGSTCCGLRTIGQPHICIAVYNFVRRGNASSLLFLRLHQIQNPTIHSKEPPLAVWHRVLNSTKLLDFIGTLFQIQGVSLKIWHRICPFANWCFEGSRSSRENYNYRKYKRMF